MMRTKLRLLLLLSLFSLLPPIIYLLLCDNDNTEQAVESTNSTRQPRTPAEKTRVLIVAHGRSGSSFLGGIFNAHPDVFFVFEPLKPLAMVTDLSSDAFLHDAEYTIQSIIGCSFIDNTYLHMLSHFSHNRASSKPLVSPPFCDTTRERAINFYARTQWDVCVKQIDAHALNKVCHNYTHVVTKILLKRLYPAGLLWALHISSVPHSFPVRILYLVRDPRAMVFSRYKIGWVAPMIRQAHSLISGEAEQVVRTTCETIERNLVELVRRRDRMVLVRYEDLAKDPEGVAKHLFQILRISPSDDVLRWIRDKSRGPVNRNIYSLSRPGKFVLNAWRKTIPMKLLMIIERECQRVMQYLGYIPTHGSKAVLKALDKPLFLKQMGDLEMSIKAKL